MNEADARLAKLLLNYKIPLRMWSAEAHEANMKSEEGKESFSGKFYCLLIKDVGRLLSFFTKNTSINSRKQKI